MDKKNKEKKAVKEKENHQQDIVELLQRTQANFENFRKQTEKRVQEIQQFANKDLILQILPVLDNFELALKNCKSDNKEFVKGIELIYSQIFTILENQNVKVIKTENQKFDPNLHEALMKVDSDKPENTIVEELQKGFVLNDKVIRCAKVKVSAGRAFSTGEVLNQKKKPSFGTSGGSNPSNLFDNKDVVMDLCLEEESKNKK